MSVHAICGCMFSGKTEALGAMLRRIVISHTVTKKQVKVFTPKKDTRDIRTIDEILSKLSVPKSIRIEDPLKILEFIDKEDEVLAVDEAQFFNSEEEIKSFVIFLEKARKGRNILVAGLDTDFLHRPWGVMPFVMAVADTIDKRYAVCSSCGSLFANYTQRLVNGKLAPKDSPQEAVGDQKPNKDKIFYEARCERCYA